MILFPAIDLKDGRCVRLRRGEMESATVFNDDPAAQARAFAEAGFKWLHCVDLNGSLSRSSLRTKAYTGLGVLDIGPQYSGYASLGLNSKSGEG